MTPAPSLKTGRNKSITDKRKLWLHDFVNIDQVLTHIPASFGLDREVFPAGSEAWGMLGNGPDPTIKNPAWVSASKNGAGCCVWSSKINRYRLAIAAGHKAAGGSKSKLRLPRFTGDEPIAMYAECTGYNPVDGSNDNGTDMVTSYKYEKTKGILLPDGTRAKCAFYLGVKNDFEHVLAACYLLGAVDTGKAFPDYAMTQFNEHKPWKYLTEEPKPQDGHCVPGVARHEKLGMDVISWSRDLEEQEGFQRAYDEEIYGVGYKVMFSRTSRQNQIGLNSQKLQEALKEVASSK